MFLTGDKCLREAKVADAEFRWGTRLDPTFEERSPKVRNSRGVAFKST